LQGFTAFSKAPGIYGAYFICGVILCFDVKNVNVKNSISPETTFLPARDAFILFIRYGILSISGGK